jgi:hypothetical protein
MDNGDVIPSLNEDWTFAGCKLFEWLLGLMAAFLVSTMFEKPAHVMPLLVLVWIGTTLTAAMLRKKFPDEERGVRNMCMVACGFAPPGIPAPARIQPFWSGGPLRSMNPMSQFMQLGLDAVVNRPQDETRMR